MNCLLCADDLILCGESKEDLKVMVGHFVEVCRRRGLKVNAIKSKGMVLGAEEGLGGRFMWMGRNWSKCQFKYLGCVLDESGTHDAKYHRRVASGMKVAGAIRSLVNGRGLHLECVRVMQDGLLVCSVVWQ